MASQRISPTIAISMSANNSGNHQQQQRLSLVTTARQKRSSISSMDSAAVVSDACDEPLYSRIDHSSSNESQREATTAAMSSITAPSNHDGMVILKNKRADEVIKNALSLFLYMVVLLTRNVNLVTLGRFKCLIIPIDDASSDAGQRFFVMRRRTISNYLWRNSHLDWRLMATPVFDGERTMYIIKCDTDRIDGCFYKDDVTNN